MSKVRKSPKLTRPVAYCSLDKVMAYAHHIQLPKHTCWWRKGEGVPMHTVDKAVACTVHCVVSWCKTREYNAQVPQKSDLCGFKWANTHKKCVHNSILYVTGKFVTRPMSYVAALHLGPN